MRKINIAIDGASGVGKSTIARSIAKKLNYLFINTGLMYRSIAYFCIENKINVADEKAINLVLNKINLELLINDEILLNSVNITGLLLSDEISIFASQIARYKELRKFCVSKQQTYTINKGVVMEGRDIGSVVIPNAELKIFLHANLEKRAKRRIVQLKEKNVQYDEHDVIKNILKRDEIDKNRKNSPLIKTKDAVEINTSNMSIKEVEEKIYCLFLERIKNE